MSLFQSSESEDNRDENVVRKMLGDYLRKRYAKRRNTSTKFPIAMIDLCVDIFMKQLRGCKQNISLLWKAHYKKVPYETFRQQIVDLREWKKKGYPPLEK